MKRREWLKGLFCAPLLAVEQPKSNAGIAVEQVVSVHFQGSVVSDTQFSKMVLKAVTDAHRMSRLPIR